METEINMDWTSELDNTQQEDAVIDRKSDKLEFNSAVTGTATLVPSTDNSVNATNESNEEDLNAQIPSTEDADKSRSPVAGKVQHAGMEDILGIVEKLTVRCLNTLCGSNTNFFLTPDFDLSYRCRKSKSYKEEICQTSNDNSVKECDVSSSNLAENETVQAEKRSEKEESMDEEESVEEEETAEEEESVEEEGSVEEEEPGEEEQPGEEESEKEPGEEKSNEEEGSDEEEEPDEEEVYYINKEHFDFISQNIDEIVQRVLDEHENNYKLQIENLMKEAINSCYDDLKELSLKISGIATTLREIQAELNTQLRDYFESQMKNQTTD